MFIDNDFPKLLGAELYRPHPAYIVEMASEPVVVHDFTKQPGQTVQLDRYRFFGNPGTKTSRERTQDQTIGTANSRSIVKDKVLVSLREYTGPADPNNSTLPSTFKIARETLMTAQRLLLDTGNLNMFHQSIGSLTLLDDYRRWRDRVFIDELFKSESRGASSDTQGGYYYPNTKTKSNSTTLNSYSATEYASERFKFNVKTDLLEVVKSLRKYRRTLKGDNKEELTKSIENLIDAYSLHLDDCIKSIYWLSKYEYPLKQMSFNEMDLKKIHSVKNYNERLELVDILCKYWEADLDLKTTTYSKEYSKLNKSMTVAKKDFRKFDFIIDNFL